MDKINIFKTENGWLSNYDLKSRLINLGAHDCDFLFVHSELNFGIPNIEIKKNEFLGILLNTLKDLNVPTLCMPTFTFSFCNGKEYDPVNSKTKMGILNEFFRKQEGVIRSNDPLLSIALTGENKTIATQTGSHSIGEGSSYDMIHNTSGVKFLFLGPHVGDCFTYVHYLEWLLNVDYRYTRSFRGTFINNGEKKEIEQKLFVRYNGVTPNNNLFQYEDYIISKKIARQDNFGSGDLIVVEEKGATEAYIDFILRNPNFFVDISLPYKDKTFLLSQEMVAL